MKLRAAIALFLALAACKGGVGRRGAGVGEACAGEGDCARPLQCVSGTCAVPPSLQACVPKARRCNGSDVMLCDAAGLYETLVQTCADGCRDGQCLEAPCNVGDRRCGPAGVEQCVGGGAGPAWTLAQACPAGCEAAACKTLSCKPLETRCSPDLQVCSADGARWLDQPCATGAACVAGTCVAQRCVPGQRSCDGSMLVQCDASGSGYSQQTQCPAGCAAGACVTPVCAGGATRCTADNGAVESCKPDGSGWGVSQQCPAPGCTALAPGRAACAELVCAPLTRRCAASAGGVEICLGDGSGWTAGVACTDGCSKGVCLPPPAGCTAGALRCDGSTVEKCDGASWNAVAQCLSGCSAGACAGASCTAGFTLAVAQPLPADGVSTVLVVSSPLLDASGAPLPDGTPVTVTATGAPPRQLRTLRGVVDFAVLAPPSPGTVTVSATVTGAASCAASLPIAFAAPASDAAFAEDFTGDLLRDFAQTSAQWQTAAGQVIATSSEAGDGRDGAFTAPAGTWDLTARIRPFGTAPFAPALRVTSVGAQSVTVEGQFADAFQPGDEALLLELQGVSTSATAAAGAWESLTVAQSAAGVVTFATPVLGVYGERPGAPLAGQRIVLQRVPHFTDLAVPGGAALTASAWDGQKGGVVAFRVSGKATIAGAVQADALGFRGGDAPDASHGQAGESYAGPAPVVTWAAPLFGGGSGGYLCGDPFHLSLLDSWFGSGGSYGGPGTSSCGGQGATYGAPALSRLFHGSGSGSQEQSSHQNCTAGVCPSESLASHGSGSASYDNRSGGNWNDAATWCSKEIVHHPGPQALPCNGNGACNDAIYGSCAGYNIGHADGAQPSDCSNSCPGLVVPNQHGGQCGGGHACYGDECGSANAGANGEWCNNGAYQCNFDNSTGFFGACGSCNHGDDYCTNCSCFLGICNTCDCYRRCYTCYAVCSTCSGCTTNPGCDTDVGCQTCNGPSGSCDMTRGGSDCAQKCPLAWQSKAAGGRGGGIVFIAAGSIDLSGGGRISARGGAPAAGNLGGAGGSLFIKAGTLRLAAGGMQIDASGAAGGGAGRIRIDRASGDDPVARQQVSPVPYTAPFALPQAQSRALPLPAGKRAISASLLQGIDAGGPAYFISADGGATWLPLTAGSTVSFAPSADVRWRAGLTPLFGAPAAVAGLSIAFQIQ